MSEHLHKFLFGKSVFRIFFCWRTVFEEVFQRTVQQQQQKKEILLKENLLLDLFTIKQAIYIYNTISA